MIIPEQIQCDGCGKVDTPSKSLIKNWTAVGRLHSTLTEHYCSTCWEKVKKGLPTTPVKPPDAASSV